MRALTINGSVPGPVLRFREGEVARIHVRNRLMAEETSTHWHGLLVPNLEDEFHANEDRDWLFHCHLLYHMKAGMARVVSYPAGDQMRTAEKSPPVSPLPTSVAQPLASTPAYRPALGEHAMPHTYAWLDASIQSHLSTGTGTIQRGRDNLNLMWEAGWEKVGRREYEIDATVSRYFNPRWSAFAGYRLTNIPDGHDAVIAGATYRLPYLVDCTATLQSNGDARIACGKLFQLTTRISLTARAEYDTAMNFSWSSTLSYTVSKRVSLVTTLDSDYGFGAGLGFRF